MKVARTWLPPIMRHAVNRALGANITFRGPFPTWTSAKAATSGYEQGAILDRIVAATTKVIDGRADFEQDGMAFSGAAPASHALSGLLLAPALDGGRLSVLDFGGGLASHFLRWRHALSCLASVHWAVVEQPHFVAEGRHLFTDEEGVSFHSTIDEVASNPNAVFSSSTLQYLEDPHSALAALVRQGCGVIVLDRIPYSGDGVERISIQHVPRQMGRASYPVWMLSRDAVHEELGHGYRLAWEFEGTDNPMKVGRYRARYHGSVWIRSDLDRARLPGARDNLGSVPGDEQ